ncbi:hypothetical protein RUM43_001592 [Polyplax serrata]|uniref:Uncharacterized protein n=1 Tax=Polyplax serrata TaxID=468196 RepID=A0AAN8SIG6_POLSC
MGNAMEIDCVYMQEKKELICDGSGKSDGTEEATDEKNRRVSGRSRREDRMNEKRAGDQPEKKNGESTEEKTKIRQKNKDPMKRVKLNGEDTHECWRESGRNDEETRIKGGRRRRRKNKSGWHVVGVAWRTCAKQPGVLLPPEKVKGSNRNMATEQNHRRETAAFSWNTQHPSAHH